VIASLNGKVIALEPGSAIIDVSGVGYLVSITGQTSKLLSLDTSIHLFTTMIVREDGFSLFGFPNSVDQKIFDLLRSVTGVGPKSALAILSAMSVDQIISSVANEDDASFKQVSGVGPKNAKLIVLTLAGKIGVTSAITPKTNPTELALVVSALAGLGWNERVAQDAAQQSIRQLGSQATTNELLKDALSRLGTSKSVGTSDE
jgi:Holliday junction DNA helicase RuvA